MGNKSNRTLLWIAAVCIVHASSAGAQQGEGREAEGSKGPSAQGPEEAHTNPSQQRAASTQKGAQEPNAAQGKAEPEAVAATQTGGVAKQAEKSSARTQPAAKVEPRTPPTRIDLDDLAAEPAQYIGKRVRVQGEIEEFISPRGFTLDEDAFTATTDVLVVLPRASVVLRNDAEVVVQGVVHQLTRAQLERDYGFLGADPDWIVRFEQRPVIMATALQNQKGEDLLVGAKAVEGGKAEKPVSAKPGAIARTPEKYYGRQLAVNGEIEDVFGSYVFTLDEDALFAGPDVLVITRKPAAAVVDGADVQVSGTLRPFTWTEIRRDYDYLGLDQDLVVRFENRPVILADAVSRTPNK